MDKGIRVAVVEQVGYREWTESLGDDREWMIQSLQSEVYSAAQREASKHGGFVLPIRYDIMLILSSGLSHRQHASILSTITSMARVPVRMSSSCGETPLDAVERAWKLLAESSGNLVYEECGIEEMVAVAHIDLNDVTKLTRIVGPVIAYYEVVDIVSEITRKAQRLGVLVQYLGGDNILAVLPPRESIENIVKELIVRSDLKAGVGVSKKARDSLAMAAHALHEIREGIVADSIVVKVA
ncbi:MAG: GTP cyclohydrolase IIa [Aeropyrum sp.]|nr:GTP cyclohydrolase IIa [Aeropyrum sp.]